LSEKSTNLGCIQFSSPAWKIAVRDEWIGWKDWQRQKNLQKIICNSRFLIFPWVKVKNLASHALSLAVARISKDWEGVYGYQPVLLETMVDQNRFAGTCYKAGNWLYVGNTKGRGRMDRENKGQKLTVKKVFVYPLIKNWREELCNGY
jgi:hypothetical protein